jgi:hypothetical protein
MVKKFKNLIDSFATFFGVFSRVYYNTGKASIEEGTGQFAGAPSHIHATQGAKFLKQKLRKKTISMIF